MTTCAAAPKDGRLVSTLKLHCSHNMASSGLDATMNGTSRKRMRITQTVPSVRESLYPPNKSKFEVYGEEMIEKEVKQSGNNGRVYLPPEWVAKHVKILRID